MIVGHVPRALSAVCCLFLGKGGTIFCEVTGRRRFSADLPQGGLEVPCTLIFTGAGKYIAGSGTSGRERGVCMQYSRIIFSRTGTDPRNSRRFSPAK